MHGGRNRNGNRNRRKKAPMNIRRVLFCFGIAAPLLYVLAVVLGGALRSDYNHLSMAVSELIEAASPNLLLLVILFSVYNVLLIGFAWAEGMSLRGEGAGLAVAGCVTLGVVGLLGLAVTIFFPMDPRGAPATIQGTLHLILSGLLSLGTILLVLFIGFGLRLRGGFWIYCLVSVAAVIGTGAYAAVSAAQGSPLLGLAERLTIGSFLQWVFVFALKLVREDMGRNR
jgi:hypothetical protein